MLRARCAFLREQRPECIAHSHHANPGNQRIQHVELDPVRNVEKSRLMQEMPQRRSSAELFGLDAVEGIMARDHGQPDGADRLARQVNEDGKRDH